MTLTDWTLRIMLMIGMLIASPTLVRYGREFVTLMTDRSLYD